MAVKSKTKNGKLYYLVSPYSHPDPFIRVLRYEQIMNIATNLTLEGYNLIEPIAMCHEKSLRYKLPSGYRYWKRRDRLLISRCDGIIVAQMEGLERSIGATDEIAYAKELGLEILTCTDKGDIIEDTNHAIYTKGE